jgi:hypothetical protein
LASLVSGLLLCLLLRCGLCRRCRRLLLLLLCCCLLSSSRGLLCRSLLCFQGIFLCFLGRRFRSRLVNQVLLVLLMARTF